MDTDFWHQRWQRNEIGFHRDRTHPALAEHWPTISADDKSPVLVPLCGKSVDMHWLARRGHPIIGIEVDALAIRAFFEEAGQRPECSDQDGFTIWSAAGLNTAITIVQGDFFDFRPVGTFDLVYDRAALIALPAGLRSDYLEHLASLLRPDARGLLITLEYPQQCMDGPPFSVMPEELLEHERLEFTKLDRRDVAAGHPAFLQRGLPWLYETAYALRRI